MTLASTIPLIILIGFLAALLASMMGLGGGLVAVPLIMLVLHGENLPAKLVSYVSIMGLAIFGAYKYWRQKRKPQVGIALLILLGVIPTAVISTIYLGPILSGEKALFHIIYAIVVVGVTILINIKDKLPKKQLPKWSLPIFGLGIGVLSGSIGLSGGVLFIPLLVVGLSIPLKEAAVTSLILKLGAATASVATNAIDGSYASALGNSPYQTQGIVWYLPLIILVGSFLGSQIGPILNKRVTDKQMRIIFNVVMTIMFLWEISSGIASYAGHEIL